MKKIIAIAAIFALTLGTQEIATAQTNKKTETKANSEKQSIEKVITAYQDALNASDAAKVVELFTKTGVLMANAAPTAEGAEAVKGTYQYVFDNFTYDLKFTVLDVVVNGNTAFVRSQSKGSFVIKASNQKVDDEFRELFVFEKENGQWKIARYMYNKTK
ncbi:MAG TPA: SgcJ/EcaC family oxidoreductase [Bacteroidia bacterium]|jgi:uncharacterized protein (TIGR02246 family)